MPRVTRTIDASIDEIETAKETAVAMLKDVDAGSTMDLFYCENLSDIEKGIKDLNEFSNKAWILSAILLYTLVYNKGLYSQSGLTWYEYAKKTRERLNLDPRDVTEQLSAARFFIMNSSELERKGFNPVGSSRKLARAELAAGLCGDVHITIDHLVNDSQTEFIEWYSSFKKKAITDNTENKNTDITFEGSKCFMKGKQAQIVCEGFSEADNEKFNGYLLQIFEALQKGYEPAIIPVYDEKEGRVLINLRDKYRQKK